MSNSNQPLQKKIKDISEEDDDILEYEDVNPDDEQQLKLWLEMNGESLVADGLMWLELYDEFNNEVQSMRSKLRGLKEFTDSHAIEDLKTFASVESTNHLYSITGNPHEDQGEYLRSKGRYEIALQQYLAWQTANIPDLDTYITHLRREAIGKVPRSWHDPLKLFIHLGIRKRIPLFPSEAAWPSILRKLDEYGEPYVEVRYYADSNRSSYKDPDFNKAVAREAALLPATYTPYNRKEFALYKKLLIASAMRKNSKEVAQTGLDKLNLSVYEDFEEKQQLGKRLKDYLFR